MRAPGSSQGPAVSWRHVNGLVCLLLLAGCCAADGWSHLAVQQHNQPRRLHASTSPSQSASSTQLVEGEGLPGSFRRPWTSDFPAQWELYLKQLGAMHLPGQTLKTANALVQNTTQLNPAQLRRSLAYQGSMHRMRRVVRDLQAGKPVKVAVLGGSISWGSAVEKGATDWFSRLLVRLRAAFPLAQISGRNGCVPATPSSFMNVCLERHLDAEADLVLLEYATNDGWNISDKHKKRTYERLLRKLLTKPKRPAVVLLQLPTVGQAFSSRHPRKRWFADTVEDVYGGFAAYYDLPYLSMRNAIWRLAQFHQYQMNFSNWYGGDYDFIHPLDEGHQSIADMVSWLLHQVVLDLARHPWSQLDADDVALPLMEPMYPGNYEEVNKLCIHGKELAAHVAAQEAWNMTNEGNDIKPKWGFVTRKVGAELRLDVNTTCNSRDSSASGHQSCTIVQLAYLRSYHGMGRALVRCSSGCSCRSTTLDGHHSSRTSTIFLLRVRPSAAPKCEISVTVLEASSSGGHKFKVTGVMASEVRSKEDWRAGEVKLNSEEWLGAVNRGDKEMQQRNWPKKPKELTLSRAPGPKTATSGKTAEDRL